MRLERKAWSAGELESGGIGQVRKGPGTFRFKNLKKIRMKLRSKMGTGVNCEIQCSGGGHSISRAKSRQIGIAQ